MAIVKKNVFRIIARPFLLWYYSLAGEKMANELKPYLKPGDEVLDLGCGLGITGWTIATKLNVEVIGTDVRDVREVDLPFILTDGEKLPFPNNKFDCILIAYVLHHVKDQKQLLSEAKRVCKGKIIIYEDTPKNLLDRVFCFLHGFSYSLSFGLQNFCKFRTLMEWEKMFSELKLKITNHLEPAVFNPVHPVRRTTFILTLA